MTKPHSVLDLILLIIAGVEVGLSIYYRAVGNTPEATFYAAAAALTLLILKL